MIKSIFLTIADEMNEYFASRYSLNEDKIIVSSLASGVDNTTLLNEDNLLISLVNIEEDRVSYNAQSLINKPVNIYVYILFTAGFSEGNYEEALELLSGAITFFQTKKVFNAQNTPDLHPSIDKLSFDMINLNIQELSQLWGINGGKYYPSVLYRARIVRIEEEGIISRSINISGFGGGANNR